MAGFGRRGEARPGEAGRGAVWHAIKTKEEVTLAAYKWKSASYVRGSAQEAGEMCERLAADGRLTAKAFLDANRPKEAPLHKAFEWNDRKAAEAYRIHQARHIISCIVRVDEKTGKPEQVRAYFTLERKDPQYYSTEVILADEDKSALLEKSAMSELAAFQKKYTAIREKLAPVYDAIDVVRMNLDGEGGIPA
jgi:hypothetical protein